MLFGWLQYKRLGKFLLLRDWQGMVQILVNEEKVWTVSSYIYIHQAFPSFSTVDPQEKSFFVMDSSDDSNKTFNGVDHNQTNCC